MTGSPLVNLAWGIVDVRDVASAHVAAITNPRAQGRYIATSDTLSFLGIVDTVRQKVGVGVCVCAGTDGQREIPTCQHLNPATPPPTQQTR